MAMALRMVPALADSVMEGKGEIVGGFDDNYPEKQTEKIQIAGQT